MQNKLIPISIDYRSNWIGIGCIFLALNPLNAMPGKAPKTSYLASDSGVHSVPKSSPIGRWKSIDDVTGKPKSIIKIWQEDGKLFGKIESLFQEPGLDPDPICKICPDSRQGAKIKGMTILWSLQQVGEWWEGGQILDPNNGKVYRCKIQTLEGGEKLRVRGFIGISILGRSQVWLRES